METIYGKQVADNFLARMDGINELIADCSTQSKTKGTVTAIDGRELISKSPHSALNLLLQGSAGIIAKQWAINFHNLAAPTLTEGIDWYQMVFVHDEYQCAVKPDLAGTLGRHIVNGCSLVTEQFNMNIPIEADYSIGLNWSETH